jgi:hypothetical protein
VDRLEVKNPAKLISSFIEGLGKVVNNSLGMRETRRSHRKNGCSNPPLERSSLRVKPSERGTGGLVIVAIQRRTNTWRLLDSEAPQHHWFPTEPST